MTDRELLELAAKAAGYGIPSADDHDEIGRQHEYHLGLWVKHPWGWGWFRPHIDDGQSLRLAVKLRLSIIQEEEFVLGEYLQTVEVMSEEREDGSRICIMQSFDDDPMTATRRAIVRAAAQIQLNKEAANE